MAGNFELTPKRILPTTHKAHTIPAVTNDNVMDPATINVHSQGVYSTYHSSPDLWWGVNLIRYATGSTFPSSSVVFILKVALKHKKKNLQQGPPSTSPLLIPVRCILQKYPNLPKLKDRFPISYPVYCPVITPNKTMNMAIFGRTNLTHLHMATRINMVTKVA